MAALMGGCSLQGMAQQITPKDVAGDKEYNRVCREYELKGGDSMEQGGIPLQSNPKPGRTGIPGFPKGRFGYSHT